MKKIALILGVMTSILSANMVTDESYSHEQRILILQEADKCIKNAKSKTIRSYLNCKYS